jgi:P-type E1-E2 ATPase
MVGGRMKTLCFDKTGTLTNNKMEICSVYHIKNGDEIEEVTNSANEIILGCFGCCNSVEIIGGEEKGD